MKISKESDRMLGRWQLPGLGARHFRGSEISMDQQTGSDASAWVGQGMGVSATASGTRLLPGDADCLGHQLMGGGQNAGLRHRAMLSQGTAGPETQWEVESQGCAGPETHPDSLSLISHPS